MASIAHTKGTTFNRLTNNTATANRIGIFLGCGLP
ncbi:hypothetical protein KAT59_05085 [Candidatus Bipolaricaulota bacterium]|nr:hypothetical protein [Candidatus Bipolaricaulota bacterium]MCK4682376.1 hypothetical protein [Candidatus Bipolaricaulota bacterium]